MTAIDDKALGLPRPVAIAPDGHGRPVPYSQAEDADGAPTWGVLDDHAVYEVCSKGGCLVCGEPVAAGKVLLNVSTRLSTPGLAAAASRRRMIREHELAHTSLVADNGPMHDRCAKITYAHCAEVRRLLAAGELRWCPYRA